MPDAPVRPCAYPGGCGEYAVRNGRCEEHAAAADQAHNDDRAFYRSPAWRRFRKWFLKYHPLCADCARAASTDVHHVKKVREFPELALKASNCMGLCHSCHAVRTERGE
jgi:5-methylcytosine-specific restriction enzyme A